MVLQTIVKLLDAQVLTGGVSLQRNIETYYGSDMMSKVLAFCSSNTLLCTGLTNRQVIRTADMTELAAIVFVADKMPAADIILQAEQEGLPLLQTKYTLEEACGILQKADLQCSH